MNDRVDVALAAGAHGVHLKEQGLLPELVRRIAPAGFVIGCSVHTTAAVTARKAADFLTAGTVLPTASKGADLSRRNSPVTLVRLERQRSISARRNSMRCAMLSP